MSLYQRHRPDEFSEVIGNKDIVVTLRNFLKKPEQIPHAFLFCGETGCGKTTFARIMATQLGCRKNNIIEIDTAQFNGIDTVRDINLKAQYIPLGGGNRFYIIDEVHRMTNDAQNAFLKILEDPPKNVYFALCTTNEKSLLPTIIGRCSRFQVSLLTDSEMSTLINKVVTAEGDSLEEEVTKQIIKSAQGHPRNALTILEQVLAAPKLRRLTMAEQAQILETQGIDLCRALLSRKKWDEVKKILAGLKSEDPEGIRRMVIGYMSSVLLNKMDDQAGLVLECFEQPFYNSGFPGLVSACYKVVRA